MNPVPGPLGEVPQHQADQKHAYVAELLDLIVDAHGKVVADMPPVDGWLAGMDAIGGVLIRVEPNPEMHEAAAVALLSLAVGRLAGGEGR